jgi:tetratricopeptide (TPR) repeat protein
MSVKVAKNRLTEFSLFRQLGEASNIVELAKRLIHTADTAQNMRQTDTVRECGLILCNFPTKEYQLIGQYYLGWLACCNGNLIQPVFFERIFEQSKTYKAKALITLGALAAANGNYEDEFRCQTEALKYSDLPTTIKTLRGMAVVKAKEGFHKSALRDLEALVPFLRYTPPPVCHDSLNSLAVEYLEVGRLEEAQNICRITLASPFLFAYPEWRETGQDLTLRGYRSRSLVPIIQSFPVNVVPMPVREASDTSTHPAIFGPAPVQGLKEWKEDKMVKEPNGEDENVDEMDFNELIVKLLQLTAQEGVDEKKVRKVVKAAIEIMKGKD